MRQSFGFKKLINLIQNRSFEHTFRIVVTHLADPSKLAQFELFSVECEFSQIIF